jgi:hypothetical protein
MKKDRDEDIISLQAKLRDARLELGRIIVWSNNDPVFVGSVTQQANMKLLDRLTGLAKILDSKT